MILEHTPHSRTLIDRLDPRVRVVSAVTLALAPIACSGALPLVAYLALLVMLTLWERIPFDVLFVRFWSLNSFMFLMVLILPWSTPGTPLVTILGASYTVDGVAQVGIIALRANTVLLVITNLLSTMELVSLAHALEKLRVPKKLIHLFSFTLRYIAVLESEYRQLRRAMTMRSFRPGFDRHTLRTFGHLVGMLLVRAMDRAQRITQAMKCRGFSGKFYSIRHYAVRKHDFAFLSVCVTVSALLFGIDRL